MQSLLDVQNAYYAPQKGPPMLLYHEHNPLRRPKRKRRKLSKKHTPIPHRPKDILPANFPASQLPEGFPPELAFRALAAYSLLRTLSCELRLSPFTPNVFLRALYLPFPSKLIGQVHASLLRILLASLNMGYACKPKGNNIPDVIRKKRRVDGIRWPLRAGDNLTFLDNFSWPLFYDDYVHLTADILWATLNSEENFGDFRNIGMPDLTGMILEEDLIEQEEEKSLMAKPARISNTMTMLDNNPYGWDTLSRSSRSARRSKVTYAVSVESDDDSYEEDAVEAEVIEEDEEDDEYMNSRKNNSTKRGRSCKRSLTKNTTAKLPTHKQMQSPYSRGTNSAASFKGANGNNQRQKQSRQAQTTPSTSAKGRTALPTSGSSRAKKTNRMLPSSRSKKSTPPAAQPEAVTKKRSPGAGRKLPTHGGQSGSPPVKKTKRSPFSGSKVEWVEEGPSPSHFGGKSSSDGATRKSFFSSTSTTPQSNAPTPLIPCTKTPSASLPMGGQAVEVPPVTAMPAAKSVSPHVGQCTVNQNSHMAQEYNAGTLARAPFAHQMHLNAAVFFPSGPSIGHNATSTPIHHPSVHFQNSGASCRLPSSAKSTSSTPNHHSSAHLQNSGASGMRLPSSAKSISSTPIHHPAVHLQNSGTSGMRLPSSAKSDRSGHEVSDEVSSALNDFIGGKSSQKENSDSPLLVGLSINPTVEGVGVKTEAIKASSINASAPALASSRPEEGQETKIKGVNIVGTSKKTSYEILTVDQPKGMPEVKGGVVKTVEGNQVVPSAGEANPHLEEKKVTENPLMSVVEMDGTNAANTKGDNSTPEQQVVNSAANLDQAMAPPNTLTKVSESAVTPQNDTNTDSNIDGVQNGIQGDHSTCNVGEQAALLKALYASSAPTALGATECDSSGPVQLADPVYASKNESKVEVTTAGEQNQALETLTAHGCEGGKPRPFGSVSAALSQTNENSLTPHELASGMGPSKDASVTIQPEQPKAVSASTPEQQSYPQKTLSAEKLSTATEKDGLLVVQSSAASKTVEVVVESSSNGVHQKDNAENRDEGDQSVSSQESDESVPFADDEEQWSQFQPIRSMRSGLPYHRLPLEEKLVILEFLIDELLAMGTFASVFTRRNLNCMYGLTYGALPSKNEFDELENEDECAICKGEGELLCCDGCVSSYHRSCIDMRQNEVLPEGRWLCPECELVDPAKYGSLKGGRKSSLDWFSVDDIHTAIRLKKANEQNSLMNPINLDGTTLTHSTWPQQNLGGVNPAILAAGSCGLGQAPTSGATIANFTLNNRPVLLGQSANPALGGLHKNNAGQPGIVGAKNVQAVLGSRGGVGALAPTTTTINSASSQASGGAAVVQNASTKVNREGQGSGKNTGPVVIQEYLVVHGFVFARSRGVDKKKRQPKSGGDSSSSLEPLSKAKLRQALQTIGTDTSLAWPLAQIPFTTLEESGPPVSRCIVHPKVLAFDTKATYDPTAYNSKYRKTPLAKSAFPGANFQAIQLLLSDYEYVCNACNLKRLSDRFSPDMSIDQILAKSLRAEAALFDPYQLIRDYMLKLENLLNRAHLLNEFWGTRNSQIKAHVWQLNVRNSRSIPRLAQLLLMLIDACHRRAFTEYWYVISGSREADHPTEEAPSMESRTLNPLPSDWTLKAEKRKRKWERSSLANVLSMLAEEGDDVEKWVYGEGRTGSIRRKRKQAVTGRSPYSPSRILVSSKDSKKFVVDDVLTNKAALTKRDISGLVDKEKKKHPETEGHGVVSVQVLQQAIDRRVTTGIPNDREKRALAAQDETTTSASTSSSRRSRRSGRLQTKKESPEDFIANVIAESGKSQKDLSMETLIEAQKMSKLVEIKELSAVPFSGTGHWPVAGRLLFDPVGNLCRSETKRLGRNAGTVMAQNVSYTGSYEVGLVSHFHVWRKNMQKCHSYEQFLLLIRSLESNLDKSTISSCEHLARRTPYARAQVSKSVRCTQKDALTGVDYHFLIQKNKNRGSWVSSLTLELSPFMVERSDRREKQQEAFSKKLREKAEVEARAREAARLKAAAEAAASHQALMREQAAARAKTAKEQAEAKAKALQEKVEAKAAAKAAKAAQKAKEKAEKAAAKAKLKAEKDAAREASKKAARAKLGHPTTATAMSQQAQNVVGIQNDVQRVLTAHKRATQQLIRESSNAGLSFVPEAEIKKLRMKAAADLQNCYRGVQISSDTLFSQLGKAENDALKAETEAKKAAVDRRLQKMAGGPQTTTNKQARQGWSQPNRPSQPGASNADLSSQRPQVGAPILPGQTENGMSFAKAPASTPHTQQATLGHNVNVSNGNRTNQQTSQTQLRANPGSNFSVTPMQVAKSTSQGGARYNATPSSQYTSHTNVFSPNPTGFFPPQHPRLSSRASASTPSSVARYTPGANVQHNQQTNPRGSMDWSANPQLLPNHLLQALGGDAGKQQCLQGLNHQLRGNSNAWNLARSSQETRCRESRESQMADLARLGGGNMQNLMSRGGMPQQQASNMRTPGSASHYQESVRGNEYSGRPGLSSVSNRLQNSMNNFSGGQFYQSPAASGGRQPFITGHNIPNMYGASTNAYGQDLAGRDERMMNAQQLQQSFDFEPTPIAEMTPAPLQAPPPNSYNPGGHPQQPRQQQQQHPHQHQWFQR